MLKKFLLNLIGRGDYRENTGRSRDPIKSGILHISDLHVTDEATARIWVALARKIRRRYNAERWSIVVTGDIVDHGHAAEFSLALRGFASLRRAGFAVYVVPGNHDYGPWGNVYSTSAHKRFLDFADEVHGERLRYPFRVDGDGWQLLCLDSTAHDEQGERFARGRIGDRQIAWLATELARPRRAWIALHHHPIWRNPFLSIVDRQALATIAGRDDRDVHYLCGHKHEEDLRLIAAGKFSDSARVIEVDPATGSVRGVDL